MLSDHYSVLYDLTITGPKPVKRKITYHNLKSIVIERFRIYITQLPIYKHLEYIYLDDLSKAYENQLSTLLDAHAFIITRTKSISNRDPWIIRIYRMLIRRDDGQSDYLGSIKLMMILVGFAKGVVPSGLFRLLKKLNTWKAN